MAPNFFLGGRDIHPMYTQRHLSRKTERREGGGECCVSVCYLVPTYKESKKEGWSGRRERKGKSSTKEIQSGCTLLASTAGKAAKREREREIAWYLYGVNANCQNEKQKGKL